MNCVKRMLHEVTGCLSVYMGLYFKISLTAELSEASCRSSLYLGLGTHPPRKNHPREKIHVLNYPTRSIRPSVCCV